MAENINPISSGGNPFMFLCISMDYEYLMIIKKLSQYGLQPSGSKSNDKMRLHEVELREAQKENAVSSKFLTVTKREQEKIQEKKKSQKAETELRTNDNSVKGAEILGKQIFQAIQMKKEHDESENKKKRNNKYQS